MTRLLHAKTLQWKKRYGKSHTAQYTLINKVGPPQHGPCPPSLQGEEEEEDVDGGDERGGEGPSHSKRQRSGFKMTREVAVPVQPVLQSAGYSACGGVQVKSSSTVSHSSPPNFEFRHSRISQMTRPSKANCHQSHAQMACVLVEGGEG